MLLFVKKKDCNCVEYLNEVILKIKCASRCGTAANCSPRSIQRRAEQKPYTEYIGKGSMPQCGYRGRLEYLLPFSSSQPLVGNDLMSLHTSKLHHCRGRP